MLAKPYTVQATILDRPLTGHAPDPATAHAVAGLYAARYASPGTHPSWWRDPNQSAPGHVDEIIVREGRGGPAHLVLLPAGHTVTESLVSCCGAALPAAAVTVEEHGHGIPCPLCHTRWSARYTTLGAHRRTAA